MRVQIAALLIGTACALLGDRQRMTNPGVNWDRVGSPAQVVHRSPSGQVSETAVRAPLKLHQKPKKNKKDKKHKKKEEKVEDAEQSPEVQSDEPVTPSQSKKEEKKERDAKKKEKKATEPEEEEEDEDEETEGNGKSWDYYYGDKDGGSDNYYYGYGGDDDSSSKPQLSTNWTRPWSTRNGACEGTRDQGRYVMEIRSIAGGAFYLGELGVGNPEQKLNMILDTGSDEIVLKSTNCTGCKGRGLDVNSSTTFQLDSEGPDAGMDYFEYGSGAVLVQRFNDTVHAGPLKGDHMNMMEILKTDVKFFQENTDDSLHAIVGMAPGLQEYVGYRLASSMKVRRFSECLPMNSNEHGFFVVNDVDPRNRGFQGPFPSVGDYYWAVSVTGFRFEWPNGEHQAMPLGTNFVGVVDTGTTLISIPQGTLDDLQGALEENSYDCANLAKLPVLKFEINNVMHELPPSAYIAEADEAQAKWGFVRTAKPGVKKLQRSLKEKSQMKVSQNRKLMYFHKPGKRDFINSKSGAQCMLLFTDPLKQNTTDGELAILGMPFFRQYEVSFDFCSREMWTHKSYGDCSRLVGKHPSNVEWCTDKDWLSCWAEGFYLFFQGFFEGIKAIFSSPKADSGGPDLDSNYQQIKAGGQIMKVQPEHMRLSSAARWLLRTSTDTDHLVSI